MKKFVTKIGILSIGAILFLSACGGGQKYTLEYKLNAGDTFKQKIEVEMAITQKAMGQEIKIDNNMDIAVVYNVVSAKNDTHNMSFEYTAVKTEAKTPMMNMTTDSNTSDTIATGSNMNAMFKAMTHVPVTYTMNKSGKISNVSGIDKLVESMMAVVDPEIDEMAKANIMLMVENQTSESSVRQMIERGSEFYPNKGVSVGESWTADSEINTNGMNINAKSKVTLKSVESNIATLEIDGTISTPEGGISQNMQGMTATINMTGTQKGILKINLTNGFPVGSDIEQNLEGEVEVMGMKMPMNVITKLKTTNE